MYPMANIHSKNIATIIHSSQHFLIVNKEPDVKINSNNSHEETVQLFLKRNYPELSNAKLVHEYYFPHRLDYATSGILCIPLGKKVCQAVSKAFSSREIKKYYIALVRGRVSEEMLNITVPIGEDSNENDVQKMSTSPLCKNPRAATTKLVILSYGLYSGQPATKVLIRPITGRRHQIRVHCKFIGHTIVGDYTYSNREDTDPDRMYLHALRLVLPNDFENLDVATKDPFQCTKEWKELTSVHSFNSAYQILE